MRRWLTFAWFYLFKPPWDSGIPAPELVRAVAARAPGNALDLGCGTGTNVRYLAEHGWHVTGLDFIPGAIQQAKRKTRGLEERVTLLVADVTKLAQLALPGPYDLALDMGCFHSLTEAGRAGYVTGLRRWLKPRGQFLLYAFQPDTTHKVWGLTRAQIEALFHAGFTLINYEQGTGRSSAWYYFEKTSDG